MRRDAGIAWRNVRSYRGRLAGLSLLIVLGCVVSLVCSGVVTQAAAASTRQVAEGTALRTIEVRADSSRPDIKVLTSDGVRALAATPHVSSVQPWLQAGFGIKNEKIGGVLLYGTTPQLDALPPIVGSVRKDLFPLHPGEVVAPKTSQGVDLTPLMGTQVSVTYTRMISPGNGEAASDTITIAGLYDPSYAEDGPSAAYADPALVVKWAAAKAGVPADSFLDTVGYRQADIVTDGSAAVPGVLAAVRAEGFDATSVSDRLASLPPTFRLLRQLGYLVIAALIGYSILSGLILASTFVRTRTREIGLLKAIGFRQSRIFRVFVLELVMAGGAAALVGVLAGNLVSIAVGYGISGRSFAGLTLPGALAAPSLVSSLLLLLAPAAAVVCGGLLPARRAAALPPDVALREF